MVERKSKEELILDIAALMPGATEDEIAEACWAAGVWSQAEKDALVAKGLEIEVMLVALELEAEGLVSIRDGVIYPRGSENI